MSGGRRREMTEAVRGACLAAAEVAANRQCRTTVIHATPPPRDHIADA